MSEKKEMLTITIRLFDDGGMTTYASSSDEVNPKMTIHLALGCIDRTKDVFLKTFLHGPASTDQQNQK